MRVYDDGDGIVCRVLPDGEVVCDKVPDQATGPVAMVISADAAEAAQADQSFVDALPEGNWGPNKIKLAVSILAVLGANDLPDERIPRRSGEIVDSVKQLLAPLPPSILLYNYSTQPANVMGAYYLNKADLVQMQRMYELFKNPKMP